MNEANADREKTREATKLTPTVSDVLADGTIIELVYRPEERTTLLAVFSAGRWTLQRHVDVPERQRLVPFSANNNLIKNEVVLLPSEPRIYGREEKLVSEIGDFIHRYADLSRMFEKIACYYVLLSWLYDAFNDLPYLRLRGDFGTGKTRSLLTIGSLCYKPFFAAEPQQSHRYSIHFMHSAERSSLMKPIFALAMSGRRSSRFSTMATYVACRCCAR
jgi:hypothetical protein